MWNDLVERFLKSKKDLKPRSKDNYRKFFALYASRTEKEFEDVTIPDIEDYLETYVKSRMSREVFKVYFRQLFKFTKKDDMVKQLPIKRANMKRAEEISVSDLLTKDDIALLIKAGRSFRDKAAVAVIYESGMRKGEFLNMKIKHVGFDKIGGFFTANGKTGPRRIRLIESVPYLQQWLENHPNKDNPDAPLWIAREYGKQDNKNEPMDESTFDSLLRLTAKRAGLRKPINPHWFRHSRLTETAKFLSDPKLKTFAGWTADSRMAGVYVHLSGKDLDEDLLKAAGMQVETTVEKSALAPKPCARCESVNPGTAEYCIKCGLPFDPSKIVDTTNETETKELKEERDTFKARLERIEQYLDKHIQQQQEQMAKIKAQETH